MRGLAIKFFLCFSIFFSTGSICVANNLSIININLDWFGLNGKPTNKTGNEPRCSTIKKFLTDNNLMADVMVFEEIVDLDLLNSEVVDGYDCTTYDNNNPRHQHVAICVKPQYRFDIADDSKSYSIDEVNIGGRLRPALHGIVKTQDGKRLFHIVGVHLKANPDKSSVRLKQVQVLVDYFSKTELTDPVILVGDFNTYNTDTAKMENQFKPISITEIPTPEPYSWASAIENFPPSKFDRTWVSTSLVPKIKSNHVIGPCNSSDKNQLRLYNREVSDHCPSKLVISF